jgi:hypothetical protein
MERRTFDQDNVTGSTVDESAAPEKTDAIGRPVRDATGPSRPPITHVYTSVGRGKGKFQNIRQKENEIKALIIGELGLTTEMIRDSLGDVDVSNKASPKRY